MRTWIAGTFAVLVTAVAVVGSAYLIIGALDRPSREDEAAEVVAAYGEAWSSAEWEALEALVIEPPPDFARVHARMWEELEVVDAAVTSGAVTVDRGRADTDLTVNLVLAGLGEWSYETSLVLFRHESQWRVEWTPQTLHPDLRDVWRFALRVEDATRAPILAHDGTPLTEPGVLYELGVHPERIEDPDDVADAFATHAGVDPERVHALLARDDLRPDWFYPIVTVREDRRAAIWPDLQPVPGIVFREAPARVTPTEGFARHVVGVVGEITAELLEELGDPYRRGDEVGLFGLERVFEQRLAGRPAAEIALVDDVDAERPPVRATLHRFEPQPPESIETTLDVAVQTAVEGALDGVEQPAAIVVLDTASGAVRGVASRPLGEFNRAFSGLYPPGSAFKIVTAAALLQSHAPDDEVACPAETVVGGLRLRNAGGLDLGATTFADAFAWSCNTTFATLAAGLDAGDLAAAAAAFGFGADYALPLGVAPGRFPEPGDLAERAAAAIGQARVQASPLHMATVAAAVASGTWRPPHLLVAEASSASRPIGDDTAEALRDLLRRAVVDGTGGAAAVRGIEVFGKTGSAEAGSGDETHAWFVGFADDLAFAVLVEGGGAGGEVAAPIAARLVAGFGADDG